MQRTRSDSFYHLHQRPANPTINTKHSINADDAAITAQCDTFENTYEYFKQACLYLSAYYTENKLKPNPTKILSSIFHLNNLQVALELQIK